MLTLTPAIICDYYTGEDRNRMMGFQSAAISGGAMVFSLIGGWLSNWGWSRAYLALLLLVPCLFAVILLMPKGIIEQEPEGENRQNHKQRRHLSSFIWFISIIGFVYYICQNTYNTNVSLFVEEAGLGTAQTTKYRHIRLYLFRNFCRHTSPAYDEDYEKIYHDLLPFLFPVSDFSLPISRQYAFSCPWAVFYADSASLHLHRQEHVWFPTTLPSASVL